MKLHESTNLDYCHFFNNRKVCSFEELGCMFMHEPAPICKWGKYCRAKICQFQHEETNEPMKEQTNENQTMSKTDLELNFPCKNCNFVSKTEDYLKIHQAAKHQAENATSDRTVISDENCDDATDTDDDDDDYDGKGNDGFDGDDGYDGNDGDDNDYDDGDDDDDI